MYVIVLPWLPKKAICVLCSRYFYSEGRIGEINSNDAGGERIGQVSREVSVIRIRGR